MAWVLMMHDGYCTVVYIFFKDHRVSQVEVVHVKCPRRPVENAHYWWDVLSHWAHHTIRGSSFFLLLSITEYLRRDDIYIYVYIYPSFRLSLLTFLLLRFILLFFFVAFAWVICRVDLPLTHPHTVTVPGAAAGWCDTLDKFGTMTIDTVLAPAIKMAEEGFPVHPMAVRFGPRTLVVIAIYRC